MEVKEEEGCHTDMHKLEDRDLEGATCETQVALGGQAREGAKRALHGVWRARGLLDKGVKGQLATYVVCAAEDPARCSVGTGR